VARTRSTELLKRDMVIREKIAQGVPRQQLADQYGITLARLSQINSEQYEGLTEDGRRDFLIAQHQFLVEKLYETVLNPPVKVNASGRLVYETLIDKDGEPVRNGKGNYVDDFSRPVRDDKAASEASKAIKGHMEELAKLQGLYQKAPKKRDEAGDLQEYMSYLQQQTERALRLEAENENLRAQLIHPRVIDAEIVQEEGQEEGTPMPRENS